MTAPERKLLFLARRYGVSFLPLVLFNGFIFVPIIYRLEIFGVNSLMTIGYGIIIPIILLNIIPLYVLLDVWSYRIGFNEEIIVVRPLVNIGPYLKMRIDEIGVVDLKALSDLGNIANAKVNPAVIVLYRNAWDGEEIFALDPRRTNLRQFKELVRQIYERRPSTFTESALRYVNGPDLITPRADAQGVFVW